MILIDQHGQWPLIIHNSYVVLIMIKLELLELDRLEYYLLGFDQGGMESDYYDVNDSNKVKTFTYPIAFQNIPLYISPTSLHYEVSNLVTLPRVLQREVTNTYFKLNHVELHAAVQKVKLSYIAVGV